MSARGRPARSAPEGEGRGIGAWLPMVGGVAVGAGILALIYKLFFAGPDPKCPIIDPKKRRWPKEKKSWFR